MAKQETPIRYELLPNEVNSFSFDSMAAQGLTPEMSDLNSLGIGMDGAVFHDLKSIYNVDTTDFAQDASIPLQTQATITNPIQFFQYLIPQAVETITQARTLDKVFGRTIAGSFEDEQIVTAIIELTGQPRIYTDTSNIPLASWNENFETRDIIRFELGLETGYLEALRATRMRVNTNGQKKRAIANGLAIEMNRIGFFGYNGGTNRTYGILNEQGLTPYLTVAEGASGSTLWADKTFEEITADIITAVAQLRVQMAGHLNMGFVDGDGARTPVTMLISLSAVDQLAKMNPLGTQSVREWIKQNYPNMKIVAAPEMDGVNGGSNVFYLIADEIDGQRTGKQYIQDTLRLIGVEKKVKTVVEDYACATAGVIITQPFGVVRYSGI